MTDYDVTSPRDSTYNCIAFAAGDTSRKWDPNALLHPGYYWPADALRNEGNNDINALKNNGSIPEGYTVNHFLTDPNAWFLTTDVPNGLKHFVRTPLSTSMDGDFDTGNVRYKARERYSFGVSDPLGIFGSPGA